MKKRMNLLLPILILNIAFGCTIKVQTGISLSNIRYNIFDNISYHENRMKQPVFIGLDYFEHQYYNISTNIGYIVRAEEENVTQNMKEMGYPYWKNELEYVSLNTTLDIKYPIDNISPFLSIGPRIDFLIDNTRKFELYKPDYLNKKVYGMIIGCGVKYDFKRVQFGIRGDYYFNFNEIAKWPGGDIMSDGGDITDQTYTFNFFLGYKL